MEGYQCDECKKFNLPPKVITLTRRYYAIGDRDMHFCSMDCLKKWVKKQETEQRELIQER